MVFHKMEAFNRDTITDHSWNMRDILFECGTVALLAAFVITIFSPLLFMGLAFFDEEQIGFYYPISAYYQRALENGDSMLWNGGYYGGVSASLDQFASPFDPLKRVIFTYLNFFDAHHWSIAIAVFAGVALAYAFGRVQGWRRTSSFVLALGYLLATKFNWLSIGTIAANSFIVFPGVALSLLLAHKGYSSWLAILLGGASLGIGLLSGFSQVVFYSAFLLGIYAVYLDWEHWVSGRRWYQNFRVSFVFAGVLLLGSAISIRQTFTSAYFIDLTIRQASYAVESAERLSPARFIAWVLPDYIELPFLGAGLNGFSVGVLPFIIIILALIFARSRQLLFYLALYLIPLGFALRIPPLSWINDYLPPFSHMRASARWMISAAFPLALLAAASIEAFIEKGIAGREKAMRLAARYAALLALMLVAATAALQFVIPRLINNTDFLEKIIAFHFRGRDAALPMAHYLEVAQNAVSNIENQFSFTNVWWAIAVMLWVGAVGFFYWLSRYRPKPRAVLAILAGAMTANTLLVFAFQYQYLVPQETMLQTPALVQALQDREPDPRTYRIMGFLIGDGMFREILAHSPLPPLQLAELERELLVNNATIFWDIQRLDGLEPYRTLRHNQLIHTVIAADRAIHVFDADNPRTRTLQLKLVENQDAWKQVSMEEKKRDFIAKLPLLSMMNVKYIYSLYPLLDPALIPINVELPADMPAKVYLYENTGVLPRIYFAQSASFSQNQGTDLLLEIARLPDFRRKTIIECGACKPFDASWREPPRFGLKEYRDGLLQIGTESTKAEWLVFSESAMPGWTAAVDGEPVSIYTTNYLFQAIQVPPGKHQIEWRYEDVFAQKQKMLLERAKTLFQ